jgi:hypothetical protein
MFSSILTASGVPTNTLANFGSSEVVAPPSIYSCVALVTRPGAIKTVDNLQENVSGYKTNCSNHRVIVEAYQCDSFTY